MLVSTRCLRNSGSNSLQHFLCNRRINLLNRFQGLAKRLRLRAKLYNWSRYNPESPLEGAFPLSFTKLSEDDLDYDKVTRELVGELLTKITFLSNRDCIQIADILARIKKPLHRIRTETTATQQIGDNAAKLDGKISPLNGVTQLAISRADQNHLTVVQSHESIAQDSTIRLIVKAQRILFAHILDAYKQKVLTKAQRYYLFCILSKECSLASLETWAVLTEDLKNDVELTSSYLPFEKANLLLIYDQVCKWLGKRLARAAESRKGDTGELPVPLSTDVTTETHKRSLHDPFDAGFLDSTLLKLVPELHQLKSEKILKLLYLQCSRGIYRKEFFEMSFRELVNGAGSHQNEVKIYRTTISIYHRATMSNLWKKLELMRVTSQLKLMDLIEGDPIANLVLIPSQKVEAVGSRLGVDTMQLRATSDLVRSLSMSLVGLLVLFIRIAHQLQLMSVPGLRDLMDVLTEHNCSDEIARSTLQHCASSELVVSDANATCKGDVGISQFVGLLRMVLSHVRFNMALLKHLPDSDEDRFIQQRCKSHLYCYCRIAELLVDIIEQRAKIPPVAHGTYELQQLVSLMKKAVGEAQHFQEGQCSHIDRLKTAYMKLERI